MSVELSVVGDSVVWPGDLSPAASVFSVCCEESNVSVVWSGCLPVECSTDLGLGSSMSVVSTGTALPD